MALVVADTNVLVYILNGDTRVSPYLDNDFIISDITEIELLGVRKLSEKDKEIRTALLKTCITSTFDNTTKEIVIQLKQLHSIKIPDAIVAATAIKYQVPLLTADKDFKKIPGLSIILIQL